MPKENNSHSELADCIEQAKALLDEALALIGSGPILTAAKRKSTPPSPKAGTTLDFGMPIRAFVKKHAKGLSGPKTFTLLVGYLARGDLDARVSRSDVEKSWNKLTGLLGTAFNPAHTSRARENDWVHAEKAGSYHLRPRWREILND